MSGLVTDEEVYLEDSESTCNNPKCKTGDIENGGVAVTVNPDTIGFPESWIFCSISCMVDYWYANLELRDRILKNYELAKQKLADIKETAKSVTGFDETNEFIGQLKKIEVG